MLFGRNNSAIKDRGLYHLPADNECGYEKYEVGTDGLLHIADGTIDGSALHILYGIQNWVERLGIPMEEAVQMASLNPREKW